MRVPKLHYVYPSCFVAGRPMDFIACGSNLLQPKFRSLISFSGKYLPHDYYVAFPHGMEELGSSVELDRQFCQIYVPHTEPNSFGPAFIEVENECGLSNFIPVLIGDEVVCSEIRIMQQKCDCACSKNKSQLRPIGFSRGICEVSCSRQTAFAEFMLDLAWLLKWPPSENFHQVLTSSQVRRFNCLLRFLMSHESASILERILQPLLFEMETSDMADGLIDSDRELFRKYMDHARDFLGQKDELTMWEGDLSVPVENSFPQNSLDNDLCVYPSDSQRGIHSLLHGESTVNVKKSRDWSRKTSSLML